MQSMFKFLMTCMFHELLEILICIDFKACDYYIYTNTYRDIYTYIERECVTVSNDYTHLCLPIIGSVIPYNLNG